MHEFFRILQRNWMLLVGGTLVGLIAGAGASVLTTPTYTSSTQLFVAIQNSGSVQELQQGNTFSQARVQSYVKTIASPMVLQPAIDELGLSETPEQLAARVTAGTDLNTVLINISVSDTSPSRAAAIARAIADSLVRAVEKLESPKAGGASPVGLSIIKPATAASSPSAPNTRLNIAAGLVVGLALGLGLSFLRTTLDNRIRGEEDFRRISPIPVLGGISFDQEASRRPLLTQAAAQSPRAESFRQLRTNLQFANVSGQARTVLVTSSLPGEGKSTTATNLAIALAQSGQSVCIVDADLRRPMVAEYLGLERSAGLTTALLGQADVDDLLQPWGDDSLYVLTSGVTPPNPSELLGSQAMKATLARLEGHFDTVVIDAPPLLPVTDAAVLAQYVGGVVLVVGSKKLRKNELEKAFKALELVDANLLGAVLNRLPAKGPDAYRYDYYRTDAPKQKKKSSGRRTVNNSNFRDEYIDKIDHDALPELEDRRPPSSFPNRISASDRSQS
ncbi:polysaccharide biosynthesis tyrosine autokinase [Arthrobacter liuii]|uniref:polysaccharide biosynthesis tyrosine autokinase n=1 Tax=Arthrobacter liuii TaxID=1476996 RepID=UPI00402BE974